MANRQKDIDWIICTSVAEGKSSLFHIHDKGLLLECVAAEKKGQNRAAMINNINIRIRQIERG